MRKTLLIVLGIAVSCSGAQADEKDYAKERLAQAERISDIFELAERPFVLEADLTVMLKSKEKGHVKIAWQSKDHWRREISFGPYSETVVRVGEQEYRYFNSGFEPNRATEIKTLLDFAIKNNHYEVKGIKTQHKHGLELTCIQLKSTYSTLTSDFETCVDPKSGEIRYDDRWKYGTNSGRAELDNYETFEGLRFPTRLRFTTESQEVVDIAVTRLEEHPFDEALLKPPTGAITRRICEGETPPTMTHPPDLPDIGDIGISGTVSLQLTIVTDGTVVLNQVIGQTSDELANRIRQKLMKMKFKPAMCGNEPVVADIVYQINIQKY